MDERQKSELLREAGNVIFDCPMDGYTTLSVGGKAEALYRAGDIVSLQRVVSYLACEEIPYRVIGKGSNLLILDGGINGVVITLCGELADFRPEAGKGEPIRAGGGLALADLIRKCTRRGLGGGEFLAGIPGTVGGAVAMNAGAWGGEIQELVTGIEIINATGDVASMDRHHLDFTYRCLSLPGGAVIIKVALDLKQETSEIVAGRVSEILKRRKAKQPLAFPSGGSVFKNPPNEFAGRLIEEAGLKGKRIGGAMISEQHANFIVNTGGAMASDILALMNLAREKVKARTGIDLEPEIQVVGF
ncbi:MAG: UDP-N-acetylmuramate dehydrogenase [Pseudomonadota bacterium]